MESPIFENELKHRMEFCILTLTNITSNRRVVECDYHCQCPKGNDCQEMILFMANQEKMASWSLCEISARNVVWDLHVYCWYLCCNYLFTYQEAVLSFKKKINKIKYIFLSETVFLPIFFRACFEEKFIMLGISCIFKV